MSDPSPLGHLLLLLLYVLSSTALLHLILLLSTRWGGALTWSSDVDKTTLSYAAIFGIKDDLNLSGEEYSWLSSVFYFGWLVWAIPSNLIMQRSPPAWYLSFNIFMWVPVSPRHTSPD